jgi:hypothetical protein
VKAVQKNDAGTSGGRSGGEVETGEDRIRSGKSLEFEEAAEMVFSEPVNRFGKRRVCSHPWTLGPMAQNHMP